jgi:hypothetical protein
MVRRPYLPASAFPDARFSGDPSNDRQAAMPAPLTSMSDWHTDLRDIRNNSPQTGLAYDDSPDFDPPRWKQDLFPSACRPSHGSCLASVSARNRPPSTVRDSRESAGRSLDLGIFPSRLAKICTFRFCSSETRRSTIARGAPKSPQRSDSRMRLILRSRSERPRLRVRGRSA